MAVETRYEPMAVYDLAARVELPFRADEGQMREMRRWLEDEALEGVFMTYYVRGTPAGAIPYEHSVFAFESHRTAGAFERRFAS